MRISKHGTESKGFEFEGFRIDPAKRLLFGADDLTVPLMPKAFDTLLLLVEHSGEVLEKDLLLSRIWPDTVVEENNLTQNISVLRKALGEKPGEHRFIVTVPGRGYKFVAETREVVPTTASDFPKIEHSSKEVEFQRGFGIIKSGNVLALADWKRPEAFSPAIGTSKTGEAAEAESSDPVRYFGGWRVWGFAALMSAIVVASVGFWKLNAAHQSEEGIGERTYTYLTDGVEVSNPAISPDGRYFVYSSFDGEFTHLWLQQVGESARLEVLPPTKKIVGEKTFSPDGQFIYFLARDEKETNLSLYRMPTFGRVYTKVLDDITSPVSFAPDGDEITFSRYNGNTQESAIVVAKKDGSSDRVIQTGTKNRYVAYPAWSPTRRSIAFADKTIDGGSESPPFCRLAAVDVDTGQIVPLSNEMWSECGRMSWTADGDGIVFVGTRIGDELSTRRNQVWYLSLVDGKSSRISNEGFWHELGGVTKDNAILIQPYDRATQLWAMDATGDSRTAVQLTSGRSDGRAGIAPLPDGRIGYIARNNDRLELWIVGPDGSNKTQLLNEPAQIEELRATPDGKYFIFLSRLDNNNHIFRIDSDGTNLVQLTSGNESIAGDATISPDSKSIVYSAQRIGGFAWLQRLSIDGGELIPITGTESLPFAPHYSPNGRLISFIVATSTKIGIVPAEGGPPLRIFDTPTFPRLNVGARWTPDGRSLAYIVHRNHVSNIWLQSLDGDPPKPLTDFTSGDIRNFAFSNDGSRIYLARGYENTNAVLVRNFIVSDPFP